MRSVQVLLMQLPQQRAVTQFQTQFLAQITVQLDPGPMHLSDLCRVFQQRDHLSQKALMTQNPGASGAGSIHQSVDPAFIESSDPAAKRAFINLKHRRHRFAGDAVAQGAQGQ